MRVSKEINGREYQSYDYSGLIESRERAREIVANYLVCDLDKIELKEVFERNGEFKIFYEVIKEDVTSGYNSGGDLSNLPYVDYSEEGYI